MSENNYYLRGVEELKAGRLEKALEFIEKAVKQEPQNASIISERGVIKLHLKDKSGALADMDLAQQLEPQKAYRYASRAFVKERFGDTFGAIKDYKTAIQLDPEDAIAHNNLGLLEEKLGYTQQSWEHLQQADELIKNMEILSKIETPLPKKKSNPSYKDIFQLMLSVFTKKEIRTEYFNYLRGLIKSKMSYNQ